MSDGLRSRYDALVTSGDVHSDPAQIWAITELVVRQDYLNASSEKRGGLFGFFTRQDEPAPRGLYIWGGVGSGKSMLMDMFFATTDIARKRRVHFHAFMQEIHEALHYERKAGTADPLKPVATSVAANARLLCLDELQINDITDAMLVGRLFEALLAQGVTLVITSNRPPDDLYLNGLNRQLFLPFIALIKARLQVHRLISDTDYRQNRLRGQQTYFHPDDDIALKAIDQIWHSVTNGAEEPLILQVKARAVHLPRYHSGVARAGFADLCEQPLGPADYLALTAAIRLLVLENIPVMNRSRNNEAKRFVTLIDTLYEAKTKLICSAEAAPEKLYQDGAGAFEFQRTASRLREMQAADWGEAG